MDDLPPSLRMESRADAPEEEVQRWAGLGRLHPETNLGVVFRVAFAHRLRHGERPLVVGGGKDKDEGQAALHFARVSSAPLNALRWPDPEDAWVLATDWGLRWHCVTDGAPGVDSVVPPTARPGARDLAYADIPTATTQSAMDGDGKIHRLSIGRATGRRRVVYVFEYFEDKGNRELFDAVLRRIAGQRRWTKATLEHLLQGIDD